MTREALTSERAVEGLTDAVVHGFPGSADVELHAIPVRPVIERRRGELGTVVALDDRWEPADAIAGIAQHPCDVVPAERAGHCQGDALPRVDVHQGEDAHRLPRRQDIVHEVHRPAFVRCQDGGPRLSDGGGVAPPPPRRERQALLEVETADLLEIDHEPIAT
jgi:hypothetical protein